MILETNNAEILKCNAKREEELREMKDFVIQLKEKVKDLEEKLASENNRWNNSGDSSSNSSPSLIKKWYQYFQKVHDISLTLLVYINHSNHIDQGENLSCWYNQILLVTSDKYPKYLFSSFTKNGDSWKSLLVINWRILIAFNWNKCFLKTEFHIDE